MKILMYHYSDVDEPGWEFDKIEFDRVNLLVGNSATGKSRFLNTIFNLGLLAVGREFKSGAWDIVFEHEGIKYSWQLRSQETEQGKKLGHIVQDNIWRYEGEEPIPLVQRDQSTFVFNTKQLPKLPPTQTAIALLKEEDEIKPLYEAFGRIFRRLFNADALQVALRLQPIPTSILEPSVSRHENDKIAFLELGLSAELYILSQQYLEAYNRVTAAFRTVFPFVQEARITDWHDLRPNIVTAGYVPVFNVREKNSDKWVPISELSSGMQKVLLILTDIMAAPAGAVYLIDEYENSLGVNAIDFFPGFLQEYDGQTQFILTSHHPYMINEVPRRQWYVFHRQGMHVSITYGDEIVEKYGKSKQQAFLQLIHDPYFTNGVE